MINIFETEAFKVAARYTSQQTLADDMNNNQLIRFMTAATEDPIIRDYLTEFEARVIAIRKRSSIERENERLM